jgi:hypothetical protein
MKAPTRREAAALARQGDAGAAEMNREQWWHMLPIRERQRALSVAGINPARAGLPLATFSDDERALVRAAIQNHVTMMELIGRCMCASNTNVHGFLH